MNVRNKFSHGLYRLAWRQSQLNKDSVNQTRTHSLLDGDDAMKKTEAGRKRSGVLSVGGMRQVLIKTPTWLEQVSKMKSRREG